MYYLMKLHIEKKMDYYSDGVSSQRKSRFEIIQEHLETQISDEEFSEEQKKYSHNPPHLKKHYIIEDYLINIIRIIVT